MSEQSGLWMIIFLSFDVPHMIYLLPHFITLYKSRNLKVIPACDRLYDSYERSEAKIFIDWAIIICPAIDQDYLWAINVIYERTESHERSYSWWLSPWCTPYSLSFCPMVSDDMGMEQFFVVTAHMAIMSAHKSNHEWSDEPKLGILVHTLYTIMQFTLYSRWFQRRTNRVLLSGACCDRL